MATVHSTAEAEGSTPARKKSVTEFAQALGLEWTREYFLAGVGPAVKLIQYHWPRKHNGSRYDQWVYVMVYSDGTFTQMLGGHGSEIKGIGDKLRAMAKASY